MKLKQLMIIDTHPVDLRRLAKLLKIDRGYPGWPSFLVAVAKRLEQGNGGRE